VQEKNDFFVCRQLKYFVEKGVDGWTIWTIGTVGMGCSGRKRHGEGFEMALKWHREGMVKALKRHE
jgi:hypothetical protein